jgi:hypothetical protein
LASETSESIAKAVVRPKAIRTKALSRAMGEPLHQFHEL